MSELDDFLKMIAEGKKTDPTAVKAAEIKEGIKSDLGSLFSGLAEVKAADPQAAKAKVIKENIKLDLGDLFSELASLKTQRDELIEQHPELEEQVEAPVEEIIVEQPIVAEAPVEVVAEAAPKEQTEVSNPTPAEDAKLAAITKYFTGKTFQQPNPDKPAAELKAITDKIRYLEQWIGKIAAHGPGSGEVNLRYLDDVARDTIQDGYYLAYNADTKKFEFREGTGTGGGGTPQVQSDWTETNTALKSYIKNKPTLATVATTGSYNDLLDQPTIPAAQIQSDWSQSNASSLAYIKNKPTIPDAQIQSDWLQSNANAVDYIKNKPTIPDIGPIEDLFAATGEPMGHADRTQSIMSFDNGNRAFTISPVSSYFDVWVKGTKYRYTSSQYVTLPNTTGLYYIYFNSSGIGYQTSFFTWDQQAMTAYVYYNADTGVGQVFDERHGITLDWQTHEYLHRTHGALYSSGFAVSNYSLNGDGSLNTHCQLDLAGGTFFDEDNQIDIIHSNTPVANTFQQDLQGPARIPVFYKSGSNGGWVLDTATDYPMKLGTNRPQFNYYNSGSWTTSEVDNNKFGVTFIVATNILNTPVIALIGQSQHSNIGDAEAYNLSEMDLGGFPVVEMRVLYRIVYECKTSYTNTPSARITSIWDLRITATPTTNITTGDHGSLTGLLDNDHPQYLLISNAAPVALTGSYNDLTDIPTLATVATSGSYNDLIDTPNLDPPMELVNGPYSVWLEDNGLFHLPYDVTLQTYSSGNLEIAPSGNQSALYLSKDSGASSLKSVEDLEFTSGSFIDPKLWTFNTDGNIVLPVGGTITNSGGTSTVIFDTDLASVATSGSYNDLIDTPTIPAAQVNSDWNSSSGVSQILNKPDLTIATLTSGTISATPSSTNDIVNKAYVDSFNSGVNFHPAVNYATTSALGSYTYSNGTGGVGATLTGVNGASLTIDGHLLTPTDVTAGTRILVKNETGTYSNNTTPSNAFNGVYSVTAVSTSGSTAWTLTRVPDFDTAGSGTNEIDAGDFMYVISGTANANTSWVQQNTNITVGSSAITFTQFGAGGTLYTAGTGLSLSVGGQFSIANTTVAANTYGSASSVPVISVNAQGQITSATNTAIAISTSNVSGLAAVATSGSYSDLSGTPTPVNLASPGPIGGTTPSTIRGTAITIGPGPANGQSAVLELLDGGDGYDYLNIYMDDGSGIGYAYSVNFPGGLTAAGSLTVGGLNAGGLIYGYSGNFLGDQAGGTESGYVSMRSMTSAQDVRIQPSASTSPYTMTLPPNSGSNTQVLQTDGAGNTSWVDQITMGRVYATAMGYNFV